MHHPLEILSDQLQKEKNLKLFFAILSGLSLLALAFNMLLTYKAGIVVHDKQKELRSLREQCVPRKVADSLMKTAERLEKVNEICLEAHGRQVAYLRDALPSVYGEDVGLDPLVADVGVGGPGNEEK